MSYLMRVFGQWFGFDLWVGNIEVVFEGNKFRRNTEAYQVWVGLLALKVTGFKLKLFVFRGIRISPM